MDKKPKALTWIPASDIQPNEFVRYRRGALHLNVKFKTVYVQAMEVVAVYSNEALSNVYGCDREQFTSTELVEAEREVYMGMPVTIRNAHKSLTHPTYVVRVTPSGRQIEVSNLVGNPEKFTRDSDGYYWHNNQKLYLGIGRNNHTIQAFMDQFVQRGN